MPDRKKPLVFISCGQARANETKLGGNIADLVRNITGWEPYFAEEDRKLTSVTTNIFAQLSECVGYIAVLHKRGEVTMHDDSRVFRASVWIEQELAIASFLAHQEKREIRLQSYVEKGIKLEGVREKIQANPIEFRSSKEVLEHLKQELPKWGDFSPMTGRLHDPREPRANVRAEFVHSGGPVHVNEGSGHGTIELMGIRAQEGVYVNAPPSTLSPPVKQSRNGPCYCGSGKKFKRCHGA